MRILHFFKTAQPDTVGGIEQVIHQICQHSSNFGTTCEVLTLSRNPHPDVVEMNGYRVHRVKETFSIASTGFSVEAYAKFKALSKDVDLIHYHFPWPFMDVIHFASRTDKPCIVSYHSDIVNQKQLLKLYRPLQNKFLRSADRIVVASPNYLESSEVLPPFRDKIRIIPIGVDKPSYPVPAPEVTARWAEKIGGRFFLFVGVLRYYKGLHVLLEALKGTDYPLVIVGDGPKKNELLAQANELGLNNVYFLGRLDDEDKVALTQLATAVVFPSHLRSEAFGITLVEGAMYGKPLISCEIGTGTTYINIANETGLVVPPEDPTALRHAMKYLWDHPEEAENMGRNAYQRYLRLFSGELMVKAYTDLYKEILAERQ
jgi:rhamnosyl/mannosyltransferase